MFSVQFSGYLNSFIQLICDFFIKKLSPETYQQLHNPVSSTPTENSQTNWQQPPNNLISNANQMAEDEFHFAVKQ